MTISQIIGWGLAALGLMALIGFLTWYETKGGVLKWWQSLLFVLATFLGVVMIFGFILLVVVLIMGKI